MFFSTICTELGYMRACTSENGLYRLDWQQTPFTDPDQDNIVSRETIDQLQAYLAGALKFFSVPIDLSGYSPALQNWLNILCSVNYGQVISYADYAERWGNRKASRAAGSACQRNPIPIIIPCHRIVTGTGGYENYSGGDRTKPKTIENINRKTHLIKLEQNCQTT